MKGPGSSRCFSMSRHRHITISSCANFVVASALESDDQACPVGTYRCDLGGVVLDAPIARDDQPVLGRDLGPPVPVRRGRVVDRAGRSRPAVDDTAPVARIRSHPIAP
jgi:hypothetical protein